jgi:hypothetical protein
MRFDWPNLKQRGKAGEGGHLVQQQQQQEDLGDFFIP